MTSERPAIHGNSSYEWHYDLFAFTTIPPQFIAGSRILCHRVVAAHPVGGFGSCIDLRYASSIWKGVNIAS